MNRKTSIVCTGHNSEGTHGKEEVKRTTAHEISHLMTAEGEHPNKDRGLAPLIGTDRTQRLRCSGDARAYDAKILVKEEWDKIEVWLKAHPDKRVFDQTGNTGNY